MSTRSSDSSPVSGATEHAASSSDLPSAGAASPPSLLDDWDVWPANDPEYDLQGTEIFKDLLIGRAQILNGIDMATMARDNKKQAVATEAFAEDTRNDSKIMKRDSATMKTITVVTLVYLPATFVSTLLSMGIFDFGVGDGDNGRIRIAREGWLFLVISLPLTALTLVLSFLWKQHKERQWKLEEDRTAAERTKKSEAVEGSAPSSAAGSESGTPETATPEPVTVETPAPESRGRHLLAGFCRLTRRSARPPADLETGEGNA
ncbi:hypothetical protein AURDEDRAFT_169471 [Auricularia subglabra TFB-10046 SS5]|nr:hypothetical protein AURDEDRAFT_169471 [Auricularia subglabra TFB-10046 SS5]